MCAVVRLFSRVGQPQVNAPSKGKHAAGRIPIDTLWTRNVGQNTTPAVPGMFFRAAFCILGSRRVGVFRQGVCTYLDQCGFSFLCLKVLVGWWMVSTAFYDNFPWHCSTSITVMWYWCRACTLHPSAVPIIHDTKESAEVFYYFCCCDFRIIRYSIARSLSRSR